MDKSDYEMYKHLPFPELFAQHQSEWLTEEDWIMIVKTIKGGMNGNKNNYRNI